MGNGQKYGLIFGSGIIALFIYLIKRFLTASNNRISR